MSACVCLTACPPGRLVGVLRPAGRPATLGVRPLTGSVVVADGRRRQGAETSVAHAAACLPRKGLRTSLAAEALFGADWDSGPWQAGRLGKSLPGRIPLAPQSRMAAAQA